VRNTDEHLDLYNFRKCPPISVLDGVKIVDSNS